VNWLVIARKEFDDAIRSRLLWGVVAFVAVLVSLTMLVPTLVPVLDADVLAGIGAASEFAAMLVPILALVAAYLAIAGERESGSLRLLLGLEPSRGTVVVGKFVGRSVVVVAGLVIGFALAGMVAVAIYGSVPPVAFASLVGLTAILGVAFVGIAIGISAATATRSRAMTLGVSAYLGLALLWDLLPQGAYLVATGAPPGQTVPAWFVFLQGLSPSGAYSALVMESIHLADPSYPTVAATLGGTTPFYVQWWAFALVLVFWTVVPLVGGHFAFSRTDLN